MATDASYITIAIFLFSPFSRFFFHLLQHLTLRSARTTWDYMLYANA